MSFSAHEMLIFLRARDEASRILARFARNAQGVDTKLISGNNNKIASYQESRAALVKESEEARRTANEKIAAINKTSSATRNSIKIQQKAMEAQRVAKSKEIISYKQSKAAIEELYGSDQKQMQEMLRALRKQHDATKVTYDQEILKIREVINKKKDLIRLANQRKLKETQATAKIIADKNKEIAKNKDLERQVKANTRAEINRAREVAAANHQTIQNYQSTGIALTTAGASAVAGGVVTVNALSQASDAAMEYNKAATTTLTQVDDKFKTTLNDIVKIGRDTANEFAVPIDEMQGALYDLYSSMDVKNKEVAANFMEQAGKAAVGGSTDIKTATNSLVSILNSYELKATDVNKVNDLMFQLVRKGVGSFSDFTNAMATANPSAHRAGQSYQEAAAMLALLTRNGIKSAKAGTSVARAFDAISNPRTADNMKDMGINIYDAQGKLKPMIKIVDMMKKSMKGLTQEQKTAKLKDMFKGSGGTIQALRFFNTALADTKGAYKDLYKDMNNASKATDENGKIVGAAEIAYKQMANTDASKILIAQNKMAIAWQKVGDAILPVKTAVFEFFAKIADAWNKLTPAQQEGIAKFAAIAAIVLIVGGGLATLIGIVLLVSAAFLTLSGAALPIVGTVLAVVAVIAILAAGAYLLINNWQAISDFFKPFIDGLVAGWNHFASVFMAATEKFAPSWKFFGDWFTRIWESILPYFQQGIDYIVNMWNTFSPFFANVQQGFNDILSKVDPFITAIANLAEIIGGFLVNAVLTAFTLIGGVVAGIWSVISTAIGNMLPGLMTIGSGIMRIINGIMDLFTGIFTLDWKKALAGIGQLLGGILEAVIGAFGAIGGAVVGIIQGLVNGIISFFTYLFDVLVGHSIIPDMITAIIDWFAGLPGQVLSFIMYLITSAVSFFAGLPGKVMSAISRLAGFLKDAGLVWFSKLLISVTTGANDVISFVKGIPNNLINALGNVGNLLMNAGKNIMQGFLDGLRNIWKNVQNFVGDIGKWIADHKGPISVDYKLLQPHGKAVMGGFNKSLAAGMRNTKRLINNFTPSLGDMNTNLAYGTTGYGMSASGANISLTVNTQEIDPVKHAADLGFEVSQRLGL